MAKKITLEAINDPVQMQKLLNAMQTQITALTVVVTELQTDHATSRASVAEIETWAETLAAKLNLDSGVNDTNYDATITNSPPATLTASTAVTEQVTKTL
jgi:hypothetical protein